MLQLRRVALVGLDELSKTGDCGLKSVDLLVLLGALLTNIRHVLVGRLSQNGFVFLGELCLKGSGGLGVSSFSFRDELCFALACGGFNRLGVGLPLPRRLAGLLQQLLRLKGVGFALP